MASLAWRCVAASCRSEALALEALPSAAQTPLVFVWYRLKPLELLKMRFVRL